MERRHQKLKEKIDQKALPAPPSMEYEFGGPMGCAICSFGLPLVIYLLYVLCNPTYIYHFNQPLPALDSIVALYDQLFSSFACYLLFGWYCLQLLLERLLPGKLVSGTTLPTTSVRLPYKVNGHLVFWITLISVSMYQFSNPIVSISIVYDEFVPLLSISCLLSYGLSLLLYCYSFRTTNSRTDCILTPHAKANAPFIYQFFMGRELNPRFSCVPGFSSFDAKYFCELRPGLIGWVVLNFGMLIKQYEKYHYVSNSMICLNAFQLLYVWDALYHEASILTTMDITTDGFGFMLVFGDLTWVPFVYSLQARYLVDYDPALSNFTIGCLIALNCLGYAIFRGANSEKNAFRTNPQDRKVQHLKYLSTRRGTKLLISGWWGLARKINYTGDWLMACAWCGTCGADSTIPYFYVIYFAILLIHRAIRDNSLCMDKYGKDWEEYQRHVPYVFIPGII